VKTTLLTRAICEALTASPLPGLPRAEFEAVLPADRPALVVRLQPSLGLVEAGRICVQRRRGSVVVEWLPAAMFALLWALQRGETIGEAAEAAFDEDPGFNAAAALTALLDAETIVSIGRCRALRAA
jgi:hypothetical protein